MLDALGNIGDFLGGIGVVVTLVYLAVQIRFSAKATRAQIVQNLLSDAASLGVTSLSGPLPEVVVKLDRGERLSPEEVNVWREFAQAQLSRQWQVFYLAREGMIAFDLVDAYYSRFGALLRTPLFRPLWERYFKKNFPPDFREHVERMMGDAA